MTFEEAMADLMLAQADVFYRPKDDSIDMAIIALKRKPKTGHWIVDTDLGYYVSTCSNCNWRGHGNESLIYKPKYCPNCGAKMVEPQESEE